MLFFPLYCQIQLLKPPSEQGHFLLPMTFPFVYGIKPSNLDRCSRFLSVLSLWYFQTHLPLIFNILSFSWTESSSIFHESYICLTHFSATFCSSHYLYSENIFHVLHSQFIGVYLLSKRLCVRHCPNYQEYIVHVSPNCLSWCGSQAGPVFGCLFPKLLSHLYSSIPYKQDKL